MARLRPALFLKVACLLALSLVIFYVLQTRVKHTDKKDEIHIHQPSTTKSNTTISKLRGPDLKQYTTLCKYLAVFSQQQVNGICAPPHPAESPVCRVAGIDHLDQRDFRPAELTASDSSGLTKLRVFVHPSKDLISNSIVSSGGWEGGYVELVLRALRLLQPSASLVDIGANLGVYSLRAAHAGRRVVAIDANYQNAIRLHKSAQSNSLQHRLLILWNALANETGPLRLRLPTDCNIGGGFPTDVLVPHWLRDPIEVRAAGLDEALLPLEHLKDVRQLLIKMDIEGCEWGAMATAAGTFSRFNVPLVFMEWRGTQVFHPEKAEFLLGFFASRNYSAFSFHARPPRMLNVREQAKWPGDVMWANWEGRLMFGKLF